MAADLLEYAHEYRERKAIAGRDVALGSRRVVVVTGGRDYSDRVAVAAALGRLLEAGPFVLVHGGASGADALCALWAQGKGIPVEEFPADWSMHGRKAGPIRNEQMASLPLSGAVAFPGGSGTADMCRRLEAHGVKVWRPA